MYPEDEPIRVLAYPKFKLDADQQGELLADYLPWRETARIPNPPPATRRFKAYQACRSRLPVTGVKTKTAVTDKGCR
jgi:hypothetical protein